MKKSTSFTRTQLSFERTEPMTARREYEQKESGKETER